MDLFTRTDLRELLEEHEQPRVSLFSPTHRDGAEEEAAFKRSAEIDARRAWAAISAPSLPSWRAPRSRGSRDFAWPPAAA